MLSAANLPSYYMSNAKGQAREATSLIDTNAESGDVVLVFPDTMHLIFDYYNNRTDVAVKQISPFLASSDNENKTREMIYSNVTRHNRVFLFASGGIESQKAQRNFILSVLNESYAKTYVKSYYAQPYNYDVYLYEKRA
jgi:hypothetical protein